MLCPELLASLLLVIHAWPAYWFLNVWFVLTRPCVAGGSKNWLSSFTSSIKCNSVYLPPHGRWIMAVCVANSSPLICLLVRRERQEDGKKLSPGLSRLLRISILIVYFCVVHSFEKSVLPRKFAHFSCFVQLKSVLFNFLCVFDLSPCHLLDLCLIARALPFTTVNLFDSLLTTLI